MANSGIENLYSAGDAIASFINLIACLQSVMGTWITCHSDWSKLSLRGMMLTHLSIWKVETLNLQFSGTRSIPFPGFVVETLYPSIHTSVCTPGFPREKAVTIATAGSTSDPLYVASLNDMSNEQV